MPKYRIITAEAFSGYFGFVIEKKGDHWWSAWQASPNLVFRDLDEAKEKLQLQKQFETKVVYIDE